MTSSLKPSDVFVPTRFPIQPDNVYADRGPTQRDLEIVLKRGYVPIVYGSYGVGKSSLTRFCTKHWESSGRLIYIESAFGKSLANIFERILEFIGYEVTIEQQSGVEQESSSNIGFETGGNILTFISAKIRGKLGRKRKKLIGSRRQLLIKSPTDSKILDLCDENKICLLIDEIHKASDSLRTQLSAFLKSYANRNSDNFRIALIGTEIDASKLIIRDPGIDRLLQEISVNPISYEEAESIVYPGFEKLGYDIPKLVADKVIKASVGSPFIVQYLCLEMAEIAESEGKTDLAELHYKMALERYTNSKAQRSLRQYWKAVETVGAKKYRKQILHAMAKCKDDYVTMEQIVYHVSQQLGESVPSTALSGPLRALKSETYDYILTDVERSKEGERIYNYSAFKDPAMKSTIRMVIELADEEERQLFTFFSPITLQSGITTTYQIFTDTDQIFTDTDQTYFYITPTEENNDN